MAKKKEKMWYRIRVEEYDNKRLQTRFYSSSIECPRIKDLGIVYKIFKAVFGD